MLPEVDVNLNEVQMVSQPSLTYKLDLDTKHIGKSIDGKEAILQAIMKILNTERYAYTIYTSQYGVEVAHLIGQDFDYVSSNLERITREALLVDDRILGINDFEAVQSSRESMTISFTVETIEGDISVESEVQIA